MWIRQDWLDALGLDVPRTWDELAEVAKAFVTRDPDGNLSLIHIFGMSILWRRGRYGDRT